jgi:hypothetical protein
MSEASERLATPADMLRALVDAVTDPADWRYPIAQYDRDLPPYPPDTQSGWLARFLRSHLPIEI